MASSDETSTYGCVHCDFACAGLTEFWRHLNTKHPETVRRLKPVQTSDELARLRMQIRSIIELNPYGYESLQSYRMAAKRERELSAKEVAATQEP